MIRKRILVIDDQKEILSLLNDFLSQSGYQVMLCQGAKNILQKIKLFKPDLILLDLLLPDGDGFEICKILSNEPDLRAIPIIVISGFGGSVDVNKAYKLGVVGYFVKPFVLSDLGKEINKVFEGKTPPA